MTRFRFRLARVLEFYGRQSELEGERLRMCVERAAHARTQLESYRKDVLARHRELIESPRLEALELAALGPFLRRAKQRELVLRQQFNKAALELDRQRGISQAAERRLRLVERLRDRQLAEHDYEASRELEELASETYLAGFARALNGEPFA